MFKNGSLSLGARLDVVQGWVPVKTGHMPDRTHVLLLRSVNLGGKNRLPMVELSALVARLGGQHVRTYIQSGNVACGLSPEAADALPMALADQIEARFGFRSPVVMREAAELERAVAAWPWDVPEGERYLYFLADLPAPERVAALDPNRSPGHRFTVIGREVHAHMPDNVAGTKLTNAWLDRQLKTVSTARNWRTTLAMLDLLRA